MTPWQQRLILSINGVGIFIILFVFDGVLRAQEGDAAIGASPNIRIETTISAAVLDDLIQHSNIVNFSALRITNVWHGYSLRGKRDVSVRFDQCDFRDGMTFKELDSETRLHLDQCRLGATAGNGRQVMFVNCWFAKPVTFRACTFVRAFQMTGCFCRDTFFLKGCTVNGEIVVDQSYFMAATSFSGSAFLQRAQFTVQADQLFDMSRCTFSDGVLLQRCRFQNGLEFSGITLERSNTNSVEPLVTINEVAIIGGMAAHLTFHQKNLNQLAISDSYFDMLRGVSWDEFTRVFAMRAPEDLLTLLPLLKHSFKIQGNNEDAEKSLLMEKALSAQKGGLIMKIQHRFMLYSSGWGTQPELLGAWFGVIVVSFSIVYLVIIWPVLKLPAPSHAGRFSFITAAVVKAVLNTFYISFAATLLQHTDDAWADLPATKSSKQIAASVQTAMRIHRLVAAVYMLMLGGYLGAQFAG